MSTHPSRLKCSSGGFATIQAAEYFVDTDPSSQAQDGAFDSEVESIKDLNVTGLTVGPHLDNNRLGRSALSNHSCSTTPIHPVVDQAVAVMVPVVRPVDFATIQAAEYFVDTGSGGRKRDRFSGTGRGL